MRCGGGDTYALRTYNASIKYLYLRLRVVKKPALNTHRFVRLNTNMKPNMMQVPTYVRRGSSDRPEHVYIIHDFHQTKFCQPRFVISFCPLRSPKGTYNRLDGKKCRYKLHKIDKEEQKREKHSPYVCPRQQCARHQSSHTNQQRRLLDVFFGVSEGGCRPQRSPTCGLLSYIHVHAPPLCPWANTQIYSVSLGSFLAL